MNQHNEIQARKDELIAVDDLLVKAMSTLKCKESMHVFLALRDTRKEITVALNNVNYDESHPKKP